MKRELPKDTRHVHIRQGIMRQMYFFSIDILIEMAEMRLSFLQAR